MSEISNTSSWIKMGTPQAAVQLRLICFHHAGGSANFFQNWQQLLPEFVQVCAIQLPGRWDRVHEKAFTSMEDLIPELYGALNEFVDKPFAILGYSFGARVAFEYVRRLRRNQRSLPILFFSLASKAPPLLRDGQKIHQLSDDDLIKNISIDYGPFPEIILQDDELRSLMLGILRADMQILETYEYNDEPAFDFPIVALGGITDRMVDSEGLAEWRKQTNHDFTSKLYDGGHFFAETAQKEVLDCISYHINSCWKKRI